jgi:hypothetical protein
MATTPADQRLTELLDRWLTSLELHLKYSSLDEDTYWRVQPWVEHQRPSRWIVDLAKQKTAALKAQVEQRVESGDMEFSDALEQMMFLANLVGLQHIERFIPVAEPSAELGRGDAGASLSATGTREMPRPSTSSSGAREMPRPSTSSSGTREMPRPAVATTGTREMPRPANATTGTREMPKPPARTERKKAPAKTPAKKRAEPATPARAAPARAAPGRSVPVPTLPVPPPPAAEAQRKQVIADAVRLLQWGRRWFELAELIARMADRPPVRLVSRLLNENRTLIEKAMAEPKAR